MFRKLNNVFRPNHQGQRGRNGGSAGVSRSEQDYHSACTVRLVRSTSVLLVAQRSQAAVGSTLKRSKSTVSIESNLYCYQRQEDRIWLHSQSQNCLEYLEALVELRRKYCQTVGDFKRSEAEATVSLKKPPPPPGKEEPVRIWNQLSQGGPEEPKTAIVLTAGTENKGLRPPSPGRGGHTALFGCGHRQLWQRCATQTLHRWRTRRCGLYRWALNLSSALSNAFHVLEMGLVCVSMSCVFPSNPHRRAWTLMSMK